MSPKEPEDRALDRYLQGDSTLSKIYKLRTVEMPPAELDAAILAEARQAAATQAGKQRNQALQRWMIPASLAAVLVLAVGLATFVFEKGGVPLAPKPLRSEGSLEQRQHPSKVLDRQTPLQQQETTRKPMGGAVDELIRRRESEPPQSNVTAPAPAGSRGEQPTTSAPADAALLKEQAKHEQRPVDKASEADQTAPAGAMAPKDLTPQEWLRHIVELRKQGKLNEAQSSFAEFRRRYPDYPADTILK